MGQRSIATSPGPGTSPGVGSARRQPPDFDDRAAIHHDRQPASCAIRPASRVAMPSCSHRQPAPTATASRACSGQSRRAGRHRRCRTAPVASTAACQVGIAGQAVNARSVRVDRHDVVARRAQVEQHAVRGAGRVVEAPTIAIRRRASQDVADRRVVEERDPSRAVMEVQQVGEAAAPVVPRIVGSIAPGDRVRSSAASDYDAREHRRDAGHPLAYIYASPAPWEGCRASEEEHIAHLKRLLALGATSSPHLCGVFGRRLVDGAVSGRRLGRRPVAAPSRPPRPRRIASAAPSSALNDDYTACVAFDTGGLGDKGFNDLAKKGLEDAAALGYTDALGRGAGRHGLRGEHPAADRQGLPDDHHGRLPAGLGDRQGDPRQPDHRVRAGRRHVELALATTSPRAPRTIRLRASRRTSPASTTRSTRRRCSPATWPRASASPARSATYGGLAFPGVTRFMDGLYAGIQYHNEKKGTDRQLLGWDGSLPDPTTTGTFVGGSGGTDTWNDPAKGEQFAKTLPRPGRRHRPSRSRARPATARSRRCSRPASGRSASTPTSASASARRPTRAILTSAQKAIDVSVLDVINKNAGGDLGGEDYSGTLANNGVLLSPFHDFDSQISADDQGRDRGAQGGASSTAASRSAPTSRAAASRPRAHRGSRSPTAPGPHTRTGGGLPYTTSRPH